MRSLEEARIYIEKWCLSHLEAADNLSVNLILFADSPHGAAVLKLCRTETFKTELAALEAMRRNACKVYERDAEGGAMLLERLVPGTTLKREPSLVRRLDIFLKLYKTMHFGSEAAAERTENPVSSAVFPTYLDWTERTARNIDSRDDYAELRDNMRLAHTLCGELFSDDSRRFLLHGDLHGDNILLGGGGYKIIDPKGVAGPPIFDLLRYMLNEYGDEPDESKRESVVLQQIERFSSELGFSEQKLRTAYFIERTMASCWTLEDKSRLPEGSLRAALFAGELLNRG